MAILAICRVSPISINAMHWRRATRITCDCLLFLASHTMINRVGLACNCVCARSLSRSIVRAPDVIGRYILGLCYRNALCTVCIIRRDKIAHRPICQSPTCDDSRTRVPYILYRHPKRRARHGLWLSFAHVLSFPPSRLQSRRELEF